MEIQDEAPARLLIRQGYDTHGDVRFRKAKVQWREMINPDEYADSLGIVGALRVVRGELHEQIAIGKLEMETANFSIPRYLAERVGISAENAAMAMSMPGRWLLFAERPSGIWRDDLAARKLVEVNRTLRDMSLAQPSLLGLVQSIDEVLYGPTAAEESDRA